MNQPFINETRSPKHKFENLASFFKNKTKNKNKKEKSSKKNIHNLYHEFTFYFINRSRMTKKTNNKQTCNASTQCDLLFTKL